MLTDNISFVVHSSDNCYGTDTVPLSPQYFISAFTFTPYGVQQTWPIPGSSMTVSHSSRPKYVPPTHSIAEAVRSTAADVRLQTTFSRPLPNQPADDDTEMTGPTIEGEITYSSEVETALDRLLSAIDHPPFTIDEEHYIALSQLPLTYPWPSITIDLRPYVPFLERHLVAHLLSGRCGLLPVDVPAHTILDAWLKLLSEAIVHGIFDLHHAAYTPPPLPALLMSPSFWHAHLNHACTRAVSPLAGSGTTDNMAGDQLAIWNQVNVRSNEPIPSTHLTIFVPPALGAFILANLKSPRGTPHSSAQLSLLNPIHPLSSPHLDLFTSISLLFFLKMKTSSWTTLDRPLRQVSFDLNLSPFLLLPTKVSTMANLVGRYAFQCHRQTLLALLADSPPQSHFNKAPIVPRH